MNTQQLSQPEEQESNYDDERWRKIIQALKEAAKKRLLEEKAVQEGRELSDKPGM